MYEFKDEFKIGVELIDEQHKRLFELTDQAYILLKDEYSIDKYDKLIALITELKEYTIFHFKSEEDYMESINYKKMFTQKIDHEEFIKKLDGIDLKALDDHQDDYILKLLQFLSEWLVEHILKKDMLIGQ